MQNMESYVRQKPAILITYFNEKELLTDCLISLKNQSISVGEILIYDDASEYPAQNYVPRNIQVTIHRSEINLGQGYGRNLLMKKTENKYIHFHDADDMFHPLWMQRITDIIHESNPDFIVTDYKLAHQQGKSSFRSGNMFAIRSLDDLITQCICAGLIPACVTFKRNLAISSGGFRERVDFPVAEDTEFHLRLLLTQPKTKVVNECLAINRIRPNSASRDEHNVLRSIIAAYHFKAIDMHKEAMGSTHFEALINMSVSKGFILLEKGFREEAVKIFKKTLSAGKPTYNHCGYLIKALAPALGPEMAFYISKIYHRVIPARLTRVLYRTIYSHLSRKDSSAGTLS